MLALTLAVTRLLSAQPETLKDGQGANLEIERNDAQVYLTLVRGKEFRNAILYRLKARPMVESLKKAYSAEQHGQKDFRVYWEYAEENEKIQIVGDGGKTWIRMRNGGSGGEAPVSFRVGQQSYAKLVNLLSIAVSGKWTNPRKDPRWFVNVYTGKPSSRKTISVPVEKTFP